MRPPKPQENKEQDLFRERLDNIINMKHELVVLAHGIDWGHLDAHFGQFFSKDGRPGISCRMMVGLHILKHTFALSDEEVCARWVENPYFQYFCGEAFFQHRFPIERSSMTHWRKRVGDEALNVLLQESLCVALRAKALKPQDLTKIMADTTVQEKAITFPTDSKLHYKAIERLGSIKRRGNKLTTELCACGQENFDYGAAVSSCQTDEKSLKGDEEASHLSGTDDSRCGEKSRRNERRTLGGFPESQANLSSENKRYP